MGQSRESVRPDAGQWIKPRLIHRKTRYAIVVTFLSIGFVAAPVAGLAADTPLGLAEAERLALENDPVVAARQARSAALSEGAVADGQLKDPKLNVGLFNLPLDDFDVTEQPSTQLRFGLQQDFPRGDSLNVRQKQTLAKAQIASARSADMARKVTRGVRDAYLDVYYQSHAGKIIEESRRLFVQLVEITESHYGAGRVSQQDVLRAQLELSRLDDRATRIRNAEEIGRARLAKWLGPVAQKQLADPFDALPALPARSELAEALKRHPAILVETASMGAASQGVKLAREQYKPGWGLGVEYRKRFGDNPDGSGRGDMAAVKLSLELPLFTAKRQDKRLAASLKQLEVATLARDDRMRELQEILAREYANWQRLGERKVLYETRLLRDAEANAGASLSAYQSGVTEFTGLMRARITELDMRLESLRVRVDREKARVHLLYLAEGEDQ